MTTTPEQKNVLLLDARIIVRMAIKKQQRFLSAEDYEELEADCLMAANRAIDDYSPDMGARLATLIYRYAMQTRVKFLRSRDRKIKGRVDIEADTIADDAESADHHEAAIHAMEITIDMARNDGTIDEHEYHVLVRRRQNFTLAEIAEEMRLSAPRIHQIQSNAVRKIRTAYRTAE